VERRVEQPCDRCGKILTWADLNQETLVSKGMDQKKSEKKKPQKTLEEKRAAKKEKKANKR
jgi:hypothetical protein